MKTFTTTGICIPDENYMVNLDERIQRIREMVDRGSYFTIHCARQYGKSTTLHLLECSIQTEFYVISLDFQGIGDASFQTEEKFVKAFCRKLKKKAAKLHMPAAIISGISEIIGRTQEQAALDELFDLLSEWCQISRKPIVMIIDEVDSASNNQVFLDFLAQLRFMYLERKKDPEYKAFQSVILAGVTDVKNLKRKIQPSETQKFNSPWNIAADFNIDMNLSVQGIVGMLNEYEDDHHTGMNTRQIAEEIFAYTGGYPFLVSRICQLMDSHPAEKNAASSCKVWTISGVSNAVKLILSEKNTLFDSLMIKVYDNAPLRDVLQRVLFGGEHILYNQYNLPAMDGEMYGFITNQNGVLTVANRIFEVLLYNYFLNLNEVKDSPASRSGSNNREQFIENGHLNMEKLLEYYISIFDDIYESKAEAFSEDEGRRRFLLFIRPVINGTGNYYVEAETRNNERMDLVIDYLGERFVIELKIWRGRAYHEKGEKQLSDYLDHYHLDKGYLLTYSFIQKKQTGLVNKVINGKTLVEAFV